MKHWFHLPSTWSFFFLLVLFTELVTFSSCLEDETVLKTPPKPELQFLAAVERGDKSEVESWLRNGVSLQVRDSLGNSALWKATDSENAELVRFLLEQGANPNQRNTAGETPAYRAVFRGNLELLTMLVTAGAEVHVKTVSGISLFDLADERGEDAILEYLQKVSDSKKKR